MIYRETIHNLLAGMEQYSPGGDGDPSQPSNAEYLRALKRAQEKPAAAGAASSASVPQQNSYPHPDRRRSPRYKCEGSAEFRIDGSEVRTWATITDLSRNGCYVEMQATSPVDTPVNMVIEVKGIRVQVKGSVRISYPFLGMGIGFTEISDHDRAQLDEILLRLANALSASVPPPDRKPSTAGALDLSTANAAGTLGAVARFFQAHATLTREQFTELIQRDGPRPRR
jgi:hypothetical protein